MSWSLYRHTSPSGDVDIDSIRNSILKAISDRKKFIRENRLKSKKMNKYDKP